MYLLSYFYFLVIHILLLENYHALWLDLFFSFLVSLCRWNLLVVTLEHILYVKS